MSRRQMQAVTGRVLPREDVALREVMASRLPAYYQAKQQRDFDERVFAANQAANERNDAMAREALEQKKKQARTANLISLADVAATAYLSREQNHALADTLNADDAVPESSATEAVRMATPLASGGDAPFFSREGAGDLKNWTGALKDHWLAIPAGVVTGVGLGRDLGREYVPFGGEAEKEAIGSAVVSGGTTYLASGGDIYSSVVSAVAGGIAGGFGW